MHAFFRLRKNAPSAIFKDPEAQEALRDVQGLLIDEAFMADSDTMTEVRKICFQIEVPKDKRQAGALRIFGYRHVLLFGDLRQLTPALANPHQPLRMRPTPLANPCPRQPSPSHALPPYRTRPSAQAGPRPRQPLHPRPTHAHLTVHANPAALALP